MGRQPFGLASPAAWLREQGASVRCVDLSRENLPIAIAADSDLVAFYLPMHTATRLATDVISHIAQANPLANLCAYGLYAPLNAQLLRSLGVRTILGGEFESGLVRLAERIANGESTTGDDAEISTERLHFRVPDREGLPSLDRYAKLATPDGRTVTVAYTEASRGCKHLCRHCPIVPVYQGVFRVVPQDVVLADIAQQIEAGAQHVTFGDPDFLNGPKHALALVTRLHQQFPTITYDVTIKVEHLIKHRSVVPTLRDTGCAFVVSAVESVDDGVLQKLDKGHTSSDFYAIADLFRQEQLALVPTFVAFNPWINLDGYAELLATIARLDLVNNVSPVQLAIRLLITEQSKLLELADVQTLVSGFDARALVHRWAHPDSRVDEFQEQLEFHIQQLVRTHCSRAEIFEEVWRRLCAANPGASSKLKPFPPLPSRSTIPYLTEPWYC